MELALTLINRNAKAIAALLAQVVVRSVGYAGFEMPSEVVEPLSIFLTAAIVWIVPNKK